MDINLILFLSVIFLPIIFLVVTNIMDEIDRNRWQKIEKLSDKKLLERRGYLDRYLKYAWSDVHSISEYKEYKKNEEMLNKIEDELTKRGITITKRVSDRDYSRYVHSTKPKEPAWHIW